MPAKATKLTNRMKPNRLDLIVSIITNPLLIILGVIDNDPGFVDDDDLTRIKLNRFCSVNTPTVKFFQLFVEALLF